MSKILGLDLGTNSIGWALIDNKKNQILGMGSRIFPMGVDNLGDGVNEQSKNASRTEARGTRRQFFRRRLRKKVLLKALSNHNMCPLNEEDFDQWKKTKKFPEETLKSWFALNPYELRHQALSHELTLEEIGRVFYHLIQRRGFLSNSRKGGKDDGAIFKGNPKEGKIGIDETLQSIQDKTLGSYLYSIAPNQDEPFKGNLERIRNRYTTRKMYVHEFEAIWEKQKVFHKTLNDDLKELLGGRKQDNYKEDGILFHQRPLRSQKHLVGNCTLEPNKTKCPISAISFELFRIHQWVNTVECNGRKISKEDREKMIEVLIKKEKPSFKDLKKAVDKIDASFKFNYKDNDKIVGTHTMSNLSNKKFFGEEWFRFTEKEQEDIWHILYFFDSKDKVKKYAIEHWNFTNTQAELISKFNLKDGYSSLSSKAIRNILPFLEIGFVYDIAVVLGGIKNAFGSEWEKLSKEQINFLLDNIEDIVRSKISGGFIETIKDLLKKEYGLNEKQLKKLYHHSATINANAILEKLPLGFKADKKIQDIRNPIVITALFEIRKLVNELINDYGKTDEIKVEMARDLKISKTRRNEIRREQKRLEKENDRIKTEVEKYVRVTHDNILKYKLWEECKATCPYTGATIPLSKLFTGEIQIEHIQPWSRSLNDSYSNKTLCWADENRRKGNKTPFEFYSADEQNWLMIKERALKLFSDKPSYPNAYQKFKRFVQHKFDEDFTSRQLNDTRYISKEAKNYLSQVCKKVSVSPGQMTSNLRYKWGLNSILNDENQKTRDDHRHHAIDALVMACGKASFLQELSRWNRYDRQYDLKDFPLPWKTFRYDAEKAVDNILTSHKRTNNVITLRRNKVEKRGKLYENTGVAARGQLHKETVFGKRKAPFSEEAFHVRKPIQSITTEKHLKKVVDEGIKKLIFKQIHKLGGFVKGKIPANTFFIVDKIGVEQPQIFLPNKNGDPVPVLKVRMKENFSGAEKLKEDLNQWVNPRNNHHVLIYEDNKGNLNEEVVTFWTAVERKRQNQPVFQLPLYGKEILTTLQINDMFLLGLSEDEIDWDDPDYTLLNMHLFRVQKVASGDYSFRHNKASTINNKNEEKRLSLKSLIAQSPIKVKISTSGRIQKV
jgi:CRISPR-associated endonuclease Csn1